MGVLHIHILEEGESMDQILYAEFVEDKYEEWCGNCEYLVCDYESCLRCPTALHALSKTPLKLLEPYPKVSQDFNAIENAWGILKARMDENQPTHLEGREEFIQRLNSAVGWVNKYSKFRNCHTCVPVSCAIHRNSPDGLQKICRQFGLHVRSVFEYTIQIGRVFQIRCPNGLHYTFSLCNPSGRACQQRKYDKCDI